MMTRDQVNQLLAHADQSISQEMQRLNVSGGGRVNVQGDLVSVAGLENDGEQPERGWNLVVWVAVSMQQIYTSTEPGQVSDTFVYEPRFLGYIDKERGTEQELFFDVLPDIVTEGDVDADEDFPGIPFQQDLPEVAPDQVESNLTKNATVTCYLRGHFTDRELTFETGFQAGVADFDLTYYQTVVEGDPIAIVSKVRETTVRARYAGASTTVAPFTTAYNSPGDTTAHFDLLTATRI
jgi:hypothetical protein